MKQSLHLGRIAGIPVGANWTVAAILLILIELLAASVLPATVPNQSSAGYWSAAVIAVLVFAVTLIVHELAHAAVAVRNGIKANAITLWMLGGMLELDDEPESPGAEARIALAGPGASLGIAILLVAFAAALSYGGVPRVIVAAVLWLGLMNAVFAAFNMLPGTPLDGGRVLRAALWRHSRDRVRATARAASAGIYLGALIVAAGIAEFVIQASLSGLWLILLGGFVIRTARVEQLRARAGLELTGLHVADVMRPTPDLAPSWLSVQDFLENVAKHSDQTVFPVVGLCSELTGILVLRQLTRIRPEDRGTVLVGQVARPVRASCLAAPDEPAGTLITRPAVDGEMVATVARQGRVVGLVTATDLDRATGPVRLGRRELIRSAS